VVRAARLRGTEFVGMAGGALLAVSLFLPWYATDTSSSHAEIGGRTGSLSAWEVHPVLRWLLLAAASAPFVLAWIILRDHTRSWARGEMTVVTSVAAFGLVAYNGFVDRPGEIGISLRFGFLRRAPRDARDDRRRRDALRGVRTPAQAARNDLGEGST
jgi:hypothetical protein